MSSVEAEFYERVRATLGIVMSGWPLRGRYERLEQMTGIGARKWKMFWNRQVRATTDIVLAVAKLRPSDAEWMLLGSRSGEDEEPYFDPSDSEIDLDEMWKTT